MKKEQGVIKVRKGERVSCPTKYHDNWNLHPRVFISFEGKKTATCPYCGTVFKIDDK